MCIRPWIHSQHRKKKKEEEEEEEEEIEFWAGGATQSPGFKKKKKLSFGLEEQPKVLGSIPSTVKKM